MEEFLVKRYLTIDLLALLVGGGSLSFLMHGALIEADSDRHQPERALIAALFAAASFVLAYLIVYSREVWFEFIPNWVVLAIFGALMNSLINFGALFVYWDSTSGRPFLTALYRQRNLIISSTIVFSLVLLIILSILMVLLYLAKLLISLFQIRTGAGEGT